MILARRKGGRKIYRRKYETRPAESGGLTLADYIAGADLWLDGDSYDGTTGTWTNEGTGGYWADHTQPEPDDRPTKNSSDSNYNNEPTATFDGTNDVVRDTLFSSGPSSATVVIVRNVDAEPPSPNTTAGFWRYQSSTDPTLSPWTDGNIYEAFGTTARKTLGNPSEDLTQPHIYDIYTASGEYTANINGNQLFTTGTNTVGWGSLARLGISISPYFFKGTIACMAIFDGTVGSAVSGGSLSELRSLLASKYGITI